MKKIVLASASERRQRLLRQVGIPFEVLVTKVDETVDSEVSPFDLAKILSERKAMAANEMLTEPALIIGADTVVSIHGKVFSKPKDDQEAFQMLHQLQGEHHSVYTGVTIINKNDDSFEVKSIVDTTIVFMSKLTDDEIWHYIETKEPFNKAGGYAIQDLGALFIEKIVGDYYTVVGLPLVKVYGILHEYGYNMFEHR